MQARLISQPSEQAFQQEKKRFTIRVLVISSLVIFGLESTLMVLLEYYLRLPQPLNWVLDGILLVIFLFPLNYYFVFLPLMRQIELNRETRQALAESERRFRAVFDQTFQQIGLLDPDGRTLLLNQTALDFSGLSEADVTGQLFWQLPWWVNAVDSAVATSDRVQQAVQKAACCEMVRCECQVRSRTGEPAIMDITFKPLLDEHGAASRIIYEARDITQRIYAEQDLKQSEMEVNRLYQAEMLARKRAETLRSAAHELSGSLNSTRVLETLLNHIFKVVPFHQAYILLLEEDDRLVVRLARDEQVSQAQHPQLGRRFETSADPFFQQVLTKREVLSIPDTQSDSQDGPGLNELCDRSCLGIPLQAGDQVIGVCLVGHAAPGFFTQDLVDWAVTLTRQASVAIYNAWLFEQVRENREHLQALSRRLVESQERERHYIARELHDEAGQALASLMLGLRHLETDSGDPAAVLAHSRELKQIADGVLENLHRLAVNLRPVALDHLGLVATLRQHSENISQQHGLAIRFETIGTFERLPGEMETAIYRIVQESLTNIIRHARASRVDILLERHENQLIIVVEDDGVGFDPQAPATSQLGVLGMRERADMLGGTIMIESSPGKGSTIVLEVPCPSAS